ncbi:uncharacterized protein LOC144172629 [Haemaphysalis longicornis]
MARWPGCWQELRVQAVVGLHCSALDVVQDEVEQRPHHRTQDRTVAGRGTKGPGRGHVEPRHPWTPMASWNADRSSYSALHPASRGGESLATTSDKARPRSVPCLP